MIETLIQPAIAAEAVLAEAVRAGFDLELIQHSLSLTPEQRAREHDSALALTLEFDRLRAERERHAHASGSAA